MRLQAFAPQKRAFAQYLRDGWGDSTGARFADIDAEQMDTRPAEGLEPLNHTTAGLRPGRGGESVAGIKENYAGGVFNTAWQRPDMPAADASLKRVELLTEARAVTLGMNLAETVQARDSAERLLARRIAAAHALAMRLMQRARNFADRSAPAAIGYGNAEREQGASLEAERLAGAAARLMETFQHGVLTLDTLRNGGQQMMTVQHVTVASGGQALVAGSVARGGRRGGGRIKEALVRRIAPLRTPVHLLHLAGVVSGGTIAAAE